MPYGIYIVVDREGNSRRFFRKSTADKFALKQKDRVVYAAPLSSEYKIYQPKHAQNALSKK